MAIISNAVFEGIADRIGYQSKQISDAIDDMEPVGGGLFFSRVTDTDDYQVEQPLITPGNTLDNNLPNFSGTEKTLLSNTFASMISGLITHVNAVGSASGITTLDSFLTTSGIDVDYNFDNAYFASQGQHLNAINVFGPQIELASVAMTGSGVGAFTDVQALGTGTGKTSAVPPNYAASALEVITNSLIGANNLILDVRTTTEDGTADSNQVIVTNGTASGVGFDVGTPATDLYIDVVNVVPAGGNNGDSVVIKNKVLRDIAL